MKVRDFQTNFSELKLIFFHYYNNFDTIIGRIMSKKRFENTGLV